MSYRQHKETIDKLTEAIAKGRTVQLRYFTASRDTTTRREVDPYRLWYSNGALYLVAHCHLRDSVRLFAVERIRSCTLTPHAFQLPLHFDLEAYVGDALRVMRGNPSRWSSSSTRRRPPGRRTGPGTPANRRPWRKAAASG